MKSYPRYFVPERANGVNAGEFAGKCRETD